jgi:hypothetical protein
MSALDLLVGRMMQLLVQIMEWKHEVPEVECAAVFACDPEEAMTRTTEMRM